jgi:hypothetical protein
MTLPFARYYGVKIRQTPIVLKFYFKSDFDRVLDSLSKWIHVDNDKDVEQK